MDKLVFVDTNVFMYAAGKSHPYKEPCLRILQAIETEVLSAAVNTEVFQELLYRYDHINIPEKGIQLCQKIQKLSLSVLPITELDISVAIDLLHQRKSKGLKPRDAIHAANMKNNGITKLLSADKDFDSFSFLSRIDPHDYEKMYQ